jgi:hypothetical protein
MSHIVAKLPQSSVIGSVTIPCPNVTDTKDYEIEINSFEDEDGTLTCLENKTTGLATINHPTRVAGDKAHALIVAEVTKLASATWKTADDMEPFIDHIAVEFCFDKPAFPTFVLRDTIAAVPDGDGVQGHPFTFNMTTYKERREGKAYFFTLVHEEKGPVRYIKHTESVYEYDAERVQNNIAVFLQQLKATDMQAVHKALDDYVESGKVQTDEL